MDAVVYRACEAQSDIWRHISHLHPNPPPTCPRQSRHGGCQRSNINNMLTDYFTTKKNCARNLFVPPFRRGEIKSTTHYNPSLSASLSLH